jgi:hypothetical protein
VKELEEVVQELVEATAVVMAMVAARVQAVEKVVAMEEAVVSGGLLEKMATLLRHLHSSTLL